MEHNQQIPFKRILKETGAGQWSSAEEADARQAALAEIDHLEMECSRLKSALRVMMNWAREVSDENIDGTDRRNKFSTDLQTASDALKGNRP